MKPGRLLRAVALLGVGACGGDGAPTDPPSDALPALSLAIVSGDGQTGPPERLLSEFLVFRLSDSGGRPVAGVPVVWEVVSGGGKVSGKRHDTDLEGLAAGNFTLGAAPGEHVARAIVHDSLAVEFTAIAMPTDADDRP